MEIKRQYRIEKLSFPVDGYSYNAQVWISVDGGENYAYCGIGKFCKTIMDTIEYVVSYEEEHCKK